jgi:hypothetical protein
MHIVSNVEGKLKPELDALAVLRATFPAGTVSGAPKVRAMEIIDELEPVKRGIYAGAVGYLGFHGDMDLAIAIRTAVIKDGRIHVQAGAGIVADSDPAAEWQETQNKARAHAARRRDGRVRARHAIRVRPAMLLMIDNYDSFTYNLVQYFGELGEDVRVFRNDEITVEEIAASNRIASSSPPAPVRRPRPASRWRRSRPSPARSRCSASASATRASARPSAARSCTPSSSCTARPRRCTTSDAGRLPRPARTLHRHALPLARHRARIAAGLPGSDRLDRRRRDHGCAPPDLPSRACSSTPNRSAPSTATPLKNFLQGR